MSDPLHILLLEDDASDAALIARELRQAFPCTIDRADSREDFAACLKARTPDLVLSDHRLASFSGMHALELMRQSSPDVPFIFVTGALDEETAVECLKAGAWDYVLKDRLVRLGPAVSAAMELRRTRLALKASQEQLLHTQRMDALGRLAGSVAHDYNNLMTAVVGYASLLAETMEGDPRKTDIDEIRLAGERAVNLTRQLLTFSRKQPMSMTALNLNEVVTGMERLLVRLLGDRSTLTLNLAPDIPTIQSDRGQLEQIVMNLVVNGGDAMADGGTVRIETSTVVLDSSHQRRHLDAQSGPHVCLAVRDSGSGIAPDILPRIFEPFFTTKSRGQGTGLGLATVHGAVRQSGGHVVVSSTPGHGSEFRVYLPVGTDVAPPVRAAVAPHHTSLAGTESILVVDADDLVVRLARRVLASRGYQVITACTRREAIGALRRADSVHLLLTDAALPDADGSQLIRDALASNPQLSVIVMSAALDGLRDDANEDLQRWNLLTKPFSPSDLLTRVRDVLDRR
jgi:signal transduction histidine kinase